MTIEQIIRILEQKMDAMLARNTDQQQMTYAQIDAHRKLEERIKKLKNNLKISS
jgi:stage III sporulation protein SpoIIIAA